MSIADWAQALSLPIVALALIVSAVQARASVQQAKLVAAQYKSVIDSLTQSAQIALTRNQTDHRATFFQSDPAMLRWYLSSRGYPTSSLKINRRRLYVLTRMDMHQLNYLNHRDGFICDDLWNAWGRVIATDIRIPEFAEMWPSLRSVYAPSFVEYCEQLLSDDMD